MEVKTKHELIKRVEKNGIIVELYRDGSVYKIVAVMKDKIITEYYTKERGARKRFNTYVKKLLNM